MGCPHFVYGDDLTNFGQRFLIDIDIPNKHKKFHNNQSSSFVDYLPTKNRHR